LVALSRWGLSYYLAGVIGDDVFGGLIEASLRKERVDTAGLVMRAMTKDEAQRSIRAFYEAGSG
jgi:sugar/nucleoside kinase (ribokinase family)